MRIISILSAVVVIAVLYLLVLERPALIAFAQGDRGAFGETAVANTVRAAFGAQPEPEASAQPEENAAEAVEPPAEQAEERRVAVVSLLSQAQEIDSAVVLRGRTAAAREVEVRAETAGRVISEPLRRGAVVEADDILCELSPGTRQAALDEAEARLAQAELEARAAERLAPDGFSSDVRVAGVRAARQTAQAAVAAAREEIDRLTIRAPFGGMLETDAAELGSLLQPGALCATVIQLDPIRLVGFVPELDVDKIALGAEAGARLASGRPVTGTVSFVARAADPATRTFRVEITVPNTDLSIRDGQTADIGITAPGTEAHLVPGSAMTLDDAGRLGLRTVDDDSRVAFVPVEIVRDTDAGVWVTGLPEVAEVIVVGQEFVTEGVSVNATRREADLPDTEPESLLEAVDTAVEEAAADGEGPADIAVPEEGAEARPEDARPEEGAEARP